MICAECGGKCFDILCDDCKALQSNRRRLHDTQLATERGKNPGLSDACLLCGYNRTSKLCTCLQRRRNSDPFHPVFGDALDFITETRYFGRDALSEAFELIQSAKVKFIADHCDENRRHSDGWDIKRIDEDAERLVARAKGKLYGTFLKMSEQPQRTHTDASDSQLSNGERLARKLAQL